MRCEARANVQPAPERRLASLERCCRMCVACCGISDLARNVVREQPAVKRNSYAKCVRLISSTHRRRRALGPPHLPSRDIRGHQAQLAKYGTGVLGRPKSFYPRLDDVTVYALSVQRVTGKSCPLPPAAEQWPAMDRTKSPTVVS